MAFDLPQFLARVRAGFLAPLLLLAALAAPLAAPILRHIPCSDDFSFHLLRLVQLRGLLQEGVFYSRWAPDMALGYGIPLFNFYAPLSYYAAALVAWLTPDLNLALRLTLSLSIVGSGLSAYLLARDSLSRPAAVVAAAAYMGAPYLGYDVYFRGNLAESLAWIWMPLALWATGRLARRGGTVWLAATALAYAAVLLTHNVFALLFSPVLALFGLTAWLGAAHTPNHRRRLAQLAAAVLLGLGVTVFFWLPALTERALVFSERLLEPPFFVYGNNFLTAGELLALPQVIYTDLINPSAPRALGLLPVLLALPALAALRRPGLRRQLVVAAGLVAAGGALLTLPLSEPLWDLVPLLRYVQFPWRLLGPAALGTALLIGAAVDVVQEALASQGRPRLAAGAGILPLLLLLTTSLYWFTPRVCSGLENPTVADIVPFEQATATIGTTAKGEYVPRTVQRYPATPAASLFAPPAGATLGDVTQSGLTRTAVVESDAPLTLVANLFAYPGWTATVNGVPAVVTPTPETGLVSVPLPAGRHRVTIAWRETPLRRLVNGVSLFSLLLLGALLLLPAGWRAGEKAHAPPARLPLAPLWLAGAAASLCLLLVFPRIESPLRRPLLAVGGLPAGFTPLDGPLVDGLRLAGYRQQQVAAAGWRYDLVWQAEGVPAASSQTTLRLLSADGLLWSPKDSDRPAGFRPPYDTRAWQPGDVALDSHLLTPLSGTPPGTYRVELTRFDRETLQPQLQWDGFPLLQLPPRPAPPPAADPFPWQFPSSMAWGDVQLLGYSIDREIARPGDPILLTLFWTAATAPAGDQTAHVALLDAAGDAVWTAVIPPVAADWPTSSWAADAFWRGQHAWRLPAALPGGDLRWTLRLCPDEAPCAAPAAELGRLTLDVPARTFTLPAADVELDAPFGDLAVLRGATTAVDQATGTLTVTLVWEARAETAASYRVFVHLLDGAGGLLAQADGEPAGWARPTSGWLPGEFIVDTHQLPWPAGGVPDGALAIGLYEPATGVRLPVAGGAGGDQLRLPLPR